MNTEAGLELKNTSNKNEHTESLCWFTTFASQLSFRSQLQEKDELYSMSNQLSGSPGTRGFQHIEASEMDKKKGSD